MNKQMRRRGRKGTGGRRRRDNRGGDRGGGDGGDGKVMEDPVARRRRCHKGKVPERGEGKVFCENVQVRRTPLSAVKPTVLLPDP
jgi:hypothetical protein